MHKSSKTSKSKSTSNLHETYITPNVLLSIRDKFDSKGWEIIDSYEHSTFQRYCKMMAQLKSSDKQNLILSLTDRFLKIDQDQYDKYLFFSVKNLFREVMFSKLHVLPLIAPNDEGKIKSSTSVAYRFKGDKIKSLPAYKGQNIKVYDKLKDLPITLNDGDIILLVDDFIGTGETAMSAYNYLLEIQPHINPETIYILSLISLKTGVDRLESNNISLYSSTVLHKGISDYYNQPELDQYIKLITEIEAQLKVQNKFKLGYGQSEALISMIRTPNNTFPIFWWSKKPNESPFPRD